MPSSASESIPYLIDFIRKHRPDLKSVLDVGIGFGKVGFLLREYFDVKNHSAFKPSDWHLHLTGVDIYDDYLSELQHLLYDEIIIGDIFEVLPDLKQYDLAVLSDVLEHLDKDEGHQLIKSLFKHASDIIITTPVGFLDHPAKGDNPHEAHKSGWELVDFEQYSVVESKVVERIRKEEQVLVVYLQKN